MTDSFARLVGALLAVFLLLLVLATFAPIPVLHGWVGGDNCGMENSVPVAGECK